MGLDENNQNFKILADEIFNSYSKQYLIDDNHNILCRLQDIEYNKKASTLVIKELRKAQAIISYNIKDKNERQDCMFIFKKIASEFINDPSILKGQKIAVEEKYQKYVNFLLKSDTYKQRIRNYAKALKTSTFYVKKLNNVRKNNILLKKDEIKLNNIIKKDKVNGENDISCDKNCNPHISIGNKHRKNTNNIKNNKLFSSYSNLPSYKSDDFMLSSKYQTVNNKIQYIYPLQIQSNNLQNLPNNSLLGNNNLFYNAPYNYCSQNINNNNNSTISNYEFIFPYQNNNLIVPNQILGNNNLFYKVPYNYFAQNINNNNGTIFVPYNVPVPSNNILIQEQDVQTNEKQN